MKFIFFQLIHFRYCCSRKMIALDSEAADRVSDGHEKKLGKGTLPTQCRNFLFTILHLAFCPLRISMIIYNFMKSVGCTLRIFV